MTNIIRVYTTQNYERGAWILANLKEYMLRQLRDYSMALILQICKQRIWTLMLKYTSRNGKRKFVSKHIETGNSKVTNEKLVFQGLSNLKLQTSHVNCKFWKSVANSYFSSILPVHKHGSKFCLCLQCTTWNTIHKSIQALTRNDL